MRISAVYHRVVDLGFSDATRSVAKANRLCETLEPSALPCVEAPTPYPPPSSLRVSQRTRIPIATEQRWRAHDTSAPVRMGRSQ